MIRAALATPLDLDITTETTISKMSDTLINHSAGTVHAGFCFFGAQCKHRVTMIP